MKSVGVTISRCAHCGTEFTTDIKGERPNKHCCSDTTVGYVYPVRDSVEKYFEIDLILDDELFQKALGLIVPKAIIVEKNGARRCQTCGIKHWNPDKCDCGQTLIKVKEAASNEV